MVETHWQARIGGRDSACSEANAMAQHLLRYHHQCKAQCLMTSQPCHKGKRERVGPAAPPAADGLLPFVQGFETVQALKQQHICTKL
eukprot:231598-Pelagomonas_calceolata.AAC.2